MEESSWSMPETEGKVILAHAKNRPCGNFRAIFLESEKRILLKLPVSSMGQFLLYAHALVQDIPKVSTMSHSHFTFRLCIHRTGKYCEALLSFITTTHSIFYLILFHFLKLLVMTHK